MDSIGLADEDGVDVAQLQAAHIPGRKKQKKKKLPWWLRGLIFDGDPKRQLVQCDCGRVMYLDAPRDIRSLHMGRSHVMHSRIDGSLYQWLRAKLGRIDKPTIAEAMKLRLRKYQ